MVEALEERASQEIVIHYPPIEAFQKDLDTVDAKKKQPVEEVVGLCVAQRDFYDLKAKVESLNKALEDMKAAEQLALERA